MFTTLETSPHRVTRGFFIARKDRKPRTENGEKEDGEMAVMGNAFLRHRQKHTEGNWNIFLQRMHSLSIIAGGIGVSPFPLLPFFLLLFFLPSHLHLILPVPICIIAATSFQTSKKSESHVSLIQFFPHPSPHLAQSSNLFSLLCCLSSQEKESAALVISTCNLRIQLRDCRVGYIRESITANG